MDLKTTLKVIPEPVEPQPGQESAWDYPRPPRIEDTQRHLQVYFQGVLVAETRRGKRVLETSHPPTYYFPPEDVRTDLLQENHDDHSWCEWKGLTHYFDLEVNGVRVPSAAWGYEMPTLMFGELKGYFAFYPQRVEACFVDGERVTPQPGDFYGGWITNDVAGPFKGGPGSADW